MDELKDNTFAGLSGNFESIYNELMNNNDPDLVMADFRSYVDAWEKLTGSYGDQETWNRKALLNTARAAGSRATAPFASTATRSGTLKGSELPLCQHGITRRARPSAASVANGFRNIDDRRRNR